MLVKVCGMREPENISRLSETGIDFMGFIFYEKSKRYTSTVPFSVPNRIKKVGVFVNEDFSKLTDTAEQNGLDALQLHGDESPEYCNNLRTKGYQIIKAFRIDDDFNFNRVNEYQTACDLFVFDAAGKNYGGNGIKFNWSVLKKYTGETKFLLSGGLSINDIYAIKTFSHRAFAGIDINSGFEIQPGLKNIQAIREMLRHLK